MKKSKLDKEKELAAEAAVAMVTDGMKVGLGTGSTAAFMIQKIGARVQKGLSIIAVPSSERTAEMAKSLNIPLSTLANVGKMDIYIDGTDEFDTEFRLIKGGGGALLREKILAHNARKTIIISDSSKQVTKLGKFKLPLETIPFATGNIISDLEEKNLQPVLRMIDGAAYRTDENNFIVDINILPIMDIVQLNHELLQIPGVVETGLFLDYTDVLIMGKEDEVLVFDVNNSK